MRVSEDEIESEEEQDEEEDRSQICTSGKRFACDDDLSLVINDKKTQIEEEIKNQISVVETEILHEIETFRSAIAKVETYREARKQVEGKLDLQYQRLVAEALDTSLTAVQERAHQEIARAEALLQATIRSEEEAKKEAEQRKAEERKLAEERVAIRAEEEAEQRKEKVVCNGQAADIALTLEKQRLKKLEELQATNKLLKSGSNQDFSRFENRVARVMKQISGTEDRVTANINDVLRIFEDPSCPVSISIATFAKKMVSSKGTLANPYACSYVVVYVTSKFPQAMDVLLAEFHKACVYTVPRNDGDVAMNTSNYYERLDSVMRLYGALVQTDVGENIHGIEHGWAWLSRFLNKTEAYNKATATALNAFLRSAGFGLHQRYRSQFLKLMSVVREHFLAKLMAEEKGDCSGLQTIVSDITAYLDYQMYLEEPKGRSMQKNHLRSRDITGF